MRKYLLDSNIIGAYLLGRSGAEELVGPWVRDDETTTSILVYGEVCEYLKGFSDVSIRLKALRTLMKKVYPYPLHIHLWSVMQR